MTFAHPLLHVRLFLTEVGGGDVDVGGVWGLCSAVGGIGSES